MWKLIKMDFYRLFNTKAFSVGMLAACIIAAAHMFLSFAIVTLVHATMGDQAAEAAGAMSIMIAQLGWLGGVDFADIVLTGTNFLTIFVGCMISASYIGSEQSCGYVKNFAGQLPNRGYMVLSKFVVTSFIQLVILLISAIISGALAPLLLGKYITGYAIPMLLSGLGLRLLLNIAVNTLIVFLGTVTKSHAIAMVAGSIFGIGVTGIIYYMAGMLLDVVKIKIDISKYMPDGINGQLSVETIQTIAGKAVVVAVVYTAVFLITNYIIVKKRDVK